MATLITCVRYADGGSLDRNHSVITETTAVSNAVLLSLAHTTSFSIAVADVVNGIGRRSGSFAGVPHLRQLVSSG